MVLRELSAPLLEVETSSSVRRSSRGRRATFESAGIDHGADRPERRREDDPVPHLSRAFSAQTRGRSSSTAGRSSASRPYAIARCGLVRTFQLTKILAAMTVLDNMMLAAPNQPGEHLRRRLLRPLAARRRELGACGHVRSSCWRRSILQPRRRLRRHAFRRAAEAARARARPDGRTAAPAPRRADGRHQPDARCAACWTTSKSTATSRE